MAGSDFTAFLALIGNFVVWVLKRTLDLVALMCLLLSCALPWRLGENLNSFDFKDSDWHCEALVSDLCSYQVVLFMSIMPGAYSTAIEMGVFLWSDRVEWDDESYSARQRLW